MQTRIVSFVAALLLPTSALAQEPQPAELAPPAEAAPVEEAPEVEVDPPETEPRALPRASGTSWVRTVHGRAAGSIVTIRCGWRRGVGFVLGSDDVVASTSAWDRCTRAIEVTLPDGRTLEVERGRVSWENGIALLRLPAPSGLRPLEPRQGALSIGDRVAILGREGRHGEEVTIRSGSVIAEPRRFIRTDLPEGAQAGAPVVDQRGRVVGVTHRVPWDDEVRIVPIARVAEVEASAEDTVGRALTFGIGAFGQLMMEEDPGIDDRDVTLGGFGVGLRATLFDRLSLTGAYAYMRDTSDMFENGLVERTARRHQAELRLGWRFLPIPAFRTYLVPSIGAWANWDRWTDRRLRVQVDDPMCSIVGSACTLTTDVLETRDDEFSITPFLHLSLQGRMVELGYSLGYHLDEKSLVHRLLLGIWFGG